MAPNTHAGSLTGKVAVVTGSGRGIGRAIALAYAGEGADLCLAARTSSQIESVAQEVRALSRQVVAVQTDVTDRHQVDELAARAADAFGRVDILVNNAAFLGPKVPVSEYPTEAWEEAVRVNLNGLFYVTRAVLGSMVPRKAGSIINVTSSV